MSQATQQKALVQLMADVINGKALPAELTVALVIARESIDQMHEEFHHTLDELEPPVREACAEHTEQALSTFDLYRTGLDLVDGALKKDNRDDLFQGAELVRRCGSQLEMLFSAIRNEALLAQGPTRIPNLNMLIRRLEAVRAGASPIEHFKNAVNQERLITLGALDGLAGAPEDSEYGALRRAFDDHLRCMNRLAMAVDAGDELAIDREMEKANNTFTYLQELIPLAQTRARTQGPSKSPKVNLLVSLARDVAEGAAHQDLLIEHYEELKRDIEPMRKIVSAASPLASVLMQEEVGKAVAALKGYDEAFRGIDYFLASRNVQCLQAACIQLVESSNLLHECHQALQDLAEREGKIVCVRCGAYTSPAHKVCSKCGATLPDLADKQAATSTLDVSAEGEPRAEAEGPVRSSNLDRIYNAVDRLAAGQISSQQFHSELNWFEGLIENELKNMPAPPLTELEGLSEQEREAAQRRAEIVQETANLYEGGVSDWREAVRRFRDYLETGQRWLLDEGKDLCDQGAKKLVKLAMANQAAHAQQESGQ